MGVSAYWPLSVLCMFCVWYQIQVLVKNHIVSDLSKLGALLQKTHIEFLLVLRYQGLICVDPHYHVAWSHNQPRTRTTERTVGVEVGGDRQVSGGGGLAKGWKKGSRQHREGVGLHKIGELAVFCQLGM